MIGCSKKNRCWIVTRKEDITEVMSSFMECFVTPAGFKPATF